MFNTKRTAGAVLIAGLAGASAGVTPVMAQGDQSATEDVIVVTAQRREQNVQDVPITLQVITSDTIDTVAGTNIGDIDVFVPGLQVGSGSPTQPRYRIRGISTSDFGVGTDPAVGVYVDGVYAARSGASLLAFNDIERIEVLKGPQGTLFGRNSAAGAVSIVTRKPSDEFEAEVGLRFGEYDTRRIDGLVNIPLTDDIALRVSGVYNERDGFYDDAATGEPLGGTENYAVKAALRWDLTDRTRAILSYSHDELNQQARPAIGIVTIPEAPDQPPFPVDTDTYLDPFNVPVFNDVIGNSERRELDEGVLTITHEVGEITLTSLSAYRYFETNNREDEDGTNRIDLYFDTNNIEKNRSYYQEFKAAGRAGAFDWLAGASYYDESARQTSATFTFTDTVNTTLGNLGLGTPFTDLENGLLIPFGVPATLLGHGWQEDIVNEGEFTAIAAFADVIWRATDRLSVTAGLRYTQDEKEFSWFNGPRVAPELDATLAALDEMGVLALAGASPEAFAFDLVFDLSGVSGLPCDNGVEAGEGVVCMLEDDWTDVSPRFVVDYKLNDDILLFGSYSEGYKAGGFNSVEVGSRFDNEDVRNIEFGVKSTFPDYNLRLNASVFQYLYEDKQAIRLVQDVDGSNVPQYLVETSDETAIGVDVEADWSPLDGFNLFGNAQWIDATFDERITRSGVDLSGEPTGEPYWSFAVGGSYVHPLGDLGEVEAAIVHAYEGERRCNAESDAQGTCLGFPAFQVGEAENRTDLRVYWRDVDGRYQLGAFVNNAFDNQYVGGVNNITANTLGTPFVSISEPRLWGVDLRVKY